MFLGTISYAFYLWHLPIFFAIRYYGGGWGSFVRVVVATSLTFFFAILSWLLLERPAQQWRRRIEARSKGIKPSPASAEPAADLLTMSSRDHGMGDE
jgi:peptidoglycan/LPS O-acetylase OafA/YrhL